MNKKNLYFISTLLGLVFLSSVARAEVDAEVAYILNTFFKFFKFLSTSFPLSKIA